MRKMTDSRQLWFRHSEQECHRHWNCVMFSIYYPIILHYPGSRGTMQTVKRGWWQKECEQDHEEWYCFLSAKSCSLQQSSSLAILQTPYPSIIMQQFADLFW